MNEHSRLQEQIEALGPWFQNITIGGVPTAPNHFLGDYPAFKWAGFRHVLPDDLDGRSVLDIGCNAGFYAMEMKRRGAGRVLGIDADPHYLRQARFAAEQEGLDIEFAQKSVYEVADLEERFDLVIFMGVLYHLRHPLLALDLIHEHVAGDMLLFQTMQRGTSEVAQAAADYDFSDWTPFQDEGFPRLYFIEHNYAGDPTTWFIPNKAATEAMLRTSGFAIDANPDPEVYLCHRADRPYAARLYA